MKTYLLRGVPHSVATDGWWLSSSAPRHPRSHDPTSASPLWPMRAGALVALIVLADLLVWQVTAPGLSLAVFGFVLLLAGWALAGRRGAAGLAAAAILFLPIIEQVQPLSIAFWILGLATGAAWIALARWPGLGAGLRFLKHSPEQVLSDLRFLLSRSSGLEAPAGLRAAYLGWFLPLGLGLVFLSLLIEANPLFQAWLDVLTRPSLDTARIAFWFGVALLAWPFLSLSLMTQRLSLGLPVPRGRSLPQVFNAGSVRRSLVLFNAVFAVQTLSDLAILVGGASLPQGMSYAEYAHRGAYPLLATALLAGVFAVAARGYVQGNRLLQGALLFWMGQTLMLTISSLIRLESYMSVYGLTYLRLAALVWMGVVAVGLSLVIGQILRNRPVTWLLRRCGLLGLGTLYLCGLTSFSATIAHYNLGHDVPLDRHYLCSLDAAALPAIREFEAATGEDLCGMMRVEPRLEPPADWREWGFRNWRTARSLAAMTAPGESPWPTF